jgi:hypothetical protein
MENNILNQVPLRNIAPYDIALRVWNGWILLNGDVLILSSLWFILMEWFVIILRNFRTYAKHQLRFIDIQQWKDILSKRK